MLNKIQQSLHLEDAKIAIQTCITKSHKLLACMALDIGFFFIYGILSTPIFEKLTQHVIIVGTLISQAMNGSGRNYLNNKSLIDILVSPQIMPFFLKFTLLLVLLGAIVYLLYCATQGIAWKISSDLAGYKISLNEYLKAFTKTNILWFTLFVLYYFGSIIFDIRKTIILKTNPNYAPNTTIEIAFIILLTTILYFMILTYISGNIKIGLKAGLRGWKEFAPPTILIMTTFLAINEIMLRTGLIRIELAYLFGLVLFLPALTIAKVYILRIAVKLAENGVLPQY